MLVDVVINLICEVRDDPLTALVLFFLYIARLYSKSDLSLNHLESFDINESHSNYCVSVSVDTLKVSKVIVMSHNASAGGEKR
jgi:hypothetical protein